MGVRNKKSLVLCDVVALCCAVMIAPSVTFCQPAELGRGEVMVKGKELFRDGWRWVPHGFYQIAFEVAPGNLARADHPFWATAYNRYSPAEYTEMRKAGRTPCVFK